MHPYILDIVTCSECLYLENTDSNWSIKHHQEHLQRNKASTKNLDSWVNEIIMNNTRGYSWRSVFKILNQNLKLKTKSKSVSKGYIFVVLTLAMLGKDTGGNAADVLSTDAGVLNLHFNIGQWHNMEVTLIGQDHQATLAVVFWPIAAKPGDPCPPHSGTI